MGELKKLTRLIRRNDLKTQVKLLKQIVSTHEPLMKARAITSKAYEDGKLEGKAVGYNEGFKAALETLKAQDEAGKPTEQELDTSDVIGIDPATLTAEVAD